MSNRKTDTCLGTMPYPITVCGTEYRPNLLCFERLEDGPGAIYFPIEEINCAKSAIGLDLIKKINLPKDISAEMFKFFVETSGCSLEQISYDLLIPLAALQKGLKEGITWSLSSEAYFTFRLWRNITVAEANDL
jgi:hypothetical protein